MPPQLTWVSLMTFVRGEAEPHYQCLFDSVVVVCTTVRREDRRRMAQEPNSGTRRIRRQMIVAGRAGRLTRNGLAFPDAKAEQHIRYQPHGKPHGPFSRFRGDFDGGDS